MTAPRPLLAAALLAALFAAVVATPVELLGCRNRGLLALSIILAGLLAALALAVRGLLRRRRDGRGPTADELVAVLLLATPAIYLVLTEF